MHAVAPSALSTEPSAVLQRFPSGRRVFVDAPVDAAHCVQVLRGGARRPLAEA